MTKPLTEEESQTLAAYNAHGIAWSTAHHEQGWWKPEMERLKYFLPAGKILEIGSGSGRDALDLMSFGYEYVGTDIADGLLEVARKNAPGLTFLKQSVYDLNFPEKSFDGFWCCATLLHVPKARIDEALQCIRRLIKAGGYGFISIKPGAGERLIPDDFGEGTTGRFFAFYSMTEFHAVLERNSFAVVEERQKQVTEKKSFLVYFVRVQ